jgi:hypothetical protein
MEELSAVRYNGGFGLAGKVREEWQAVVTEDTGVTDELFVVTSDFKLLPK